MNQNYFKYLSVTPFEYQWGIYVTSIGCSKVEPNDHYPNQDHPASHQLTWDRGRTLNDYYIVFISRGKGTYGSALNDPFEVVAGNCFMLYPEVWHRYKPDKRHGWEEYWVGFNGTYVKQLMNEGLFDPKNPVIDLGFNTDVLILYKKLIDMVKVSLVGYPQQVAGLVMQILGLVNQATKYNDRGSDPIAKLIAKAKFIIQESFENSLDMEQLAAAIPMGYSAFRKSFKKITGQSPNQYHLNLRLERARNLLATTALNVNEVAQQTGFESVFYFSKLFKKKHGISPKNYRLTGNTE
ncbi:helix-turn-helix transcriptional regulator [Pedobacter sp. PWIIR3]